MKEGKVVCKTGQARTQAGLDRTGGVQMERGRTSDHRRLDEFSDMSCQLVAAAKPTSGFRF